MPKVGIVIPSQDWVWKFFSISLAEMAFNCGCAPGIGIEFVPIEWALIADARNYGAIEALRRGCDYVLFLDYDHVLPPETLRWLLGAAMSRPDVDIIGCAHAKRIAPHEVVGNWSPELKIEPDGVYEVEQLGGGCLLVARRVFEKLGHFAFQTPVIEKFGGHCMYPEDLYFCDEARKAGFKIWMHAGLSLVIGHIGRQVVYVGGPRRWEAASGTQDASIEELTIAQRDGDQALIVDGLANLNSAMRIRAEARERELRRSGATAQQQGA